ncbi:MAG: PEP-CTERM sorting domain-containing protein [Deltaproteobacteria bacterium]|nr:PEP-CTERM sorting domain-containing protein [Deltaproteobacteria bacterium]
MRRLLFLCVLLLVFSPLTASADSFSLWEVFPQTTPSNDPGLSVGAWEPNNSTYAPLFYITDYSFARYLSGATPTIQRMDIPWIQMVPSASEYAVLSGHGDSPELINVSGQFRANYGGTVAVIIGTVFNNIPTYRWGATLNGGSPNSADFTLTNIYVSPEISLFFAVNSLEDPDNDATWLQSTIETTPVPLPGTLLLLGSGLLGLAGWGRRLRKS